MRVVIQHLRGIPTRNEEQVERFIVDDGAIGAVRPFGVADAVGDPSGCVDEDAPRRLARARAPAERNILVGEPGVDAKRVFDLRLDQLPALVERAEFLAQPVHRLAGAQCEGGDPLRSRARATDHRQAREAAEMFIGDRSENPLIVVKEPDRQRLASDFQPRVAGSECPGAG